MIIFDAKTGRFRDAETGLLKKDVSGLLSSYGRRSLKEAIGKQTLEEYRNKLAKGYYKPHERKPKKEEEKREKKPTKKRAIIEPATTTDFDDYLTDWLETYDDLLQDEDTDLETP